MDVLKLLLTPERKPELDSWKALVERINHPNKTVKIAIAGKYLPQMMSEEEIKAEIMALADKSVPSVMKHFKTNFNGKCDMRKVQEVLKGI